MQKKALFLVLFLFMFLFSALLSSNFTTAQVGVKTDTFSNKKQIPRHGIHDNNLVKDRHSLYLTRPNERDVSYSKIVWREIIFEELNNKLFIAENYAFTDMVFAALHRGEIPAYSADDFENPIPKEDVARNTGIHISNSFMLTQEEELAILKAAERIPPETIISIRIKEGWYFDEATSKMEVRILGLGFVMIRQNDNGDILFRGVIFWLYYPEVRDFLAKKPVPNQPNTTWADIFEQRRFGSYITKENNLSDSRIKDKKNHYDALLEAEQLKKQQQNREADRNED